MALELTMILEDPSIYALLGIGLVAVIIILIRRGDAIRRRFELKTRDVDLDC